MTKEQSMIKAERIRLEYILSTANQIKEDALSQLRFLCDNCKHDGEKSWEQSASGNESYYICDLCGAEC
jgi:hypothetical protein